MKWILQQAAFFLSVAIVAFLVVEVGYRANLLLKTPRLQFKQEALTELPPVAAYSRSLWRFDAKVGFQYTDRTGIFLATVANGRIAGCSAVDPLNKDGSPGISEGKYEDADFKLALFGDSFSVSTDDRNRTWVNRLQGRLQERLGRSVHILNFARDGMGLLQTFDVAASELPRRKPHLAIFAFNTVQMKAPRIWRVAKWIAGEPRVLTTREKTEDPDVNDRGSVYDTFILDPEINAEWCDKNKNGGELDRVGKDIIDKYLRFREPRYSALTLSHSFFWNRVLRGDPFYAGVKPHVIMDDFNNDPDLRKDLADIRESGVPMLLVHLPYSMEVSAGTEFSDKQSKEIANGLTRMTGQPVHGLVSKIGPIDRPERMNSSPDNMHPSTFGMDLYAEAVSKVILKNGPVVQLKAQ
jgi:lysophospholipase L1-like esterase